MQNSVSTKLKTSPQTLPIIFFPFFSSLKWSKMIHMSNEVLIKVFTGREKVVSNVRDGLCGIPLIFRKHIVTEYPTIKKEVYSLTSQRNFSVAKAVALNWETFSFHVWIQSWRSERSLAVLSGRCPALKEHRNHSLQWITEPVWHQAQTLLISG